MLGRRERELYQAQITERERERDEARAELDRRRASPLEDAVGSSAVLHCDDRRSVAGVITGVHDREVTLEAARVLQEGAGAVGMDGAIIVPRKRIVWYQIGITIDDGKLPA